MTDEKPAADDAAESAAGNEPEFEPVGGAGHGDGGASGLDAKQIQGFAALFLRRIVKSNFQQERANPDEREALAAAGITDELSQDYAAWRRSVLWVATVLLGVTAVVSLIAFIANVIKAGEHNMSLPFSAIVAELVPLAAIGVGAFLGFLAAMQWTSMTASRNLARNAWALIIIAPFVVALIPWGIFGGGVQSMQDMIGTLILGIALFFKVAPTVIGLSAGLVRASMTIKTMLPESPMPGWVTVCFAPVASILLLSMFVLLNQVAGSIMLPIALLCLAAGPLVYVWKFKEIVRAHTPDEVTAVVGGVRQLSLIVSAIGVALIFLMFVEAGGIDFWQLLQFIIAVIGNVLLLTVVASDFLLATLTGAHRQSQRYAGTDLEKGLLSKLDGLEASGLTDIPRFEIGIGGGSGNGEAPRGAAVEPAGADKPDDDAG